MKRRFSVCGVGFSLLLVIGLAACGPSKEEIAGMLAEQRDQIEQDSQKREAEIREEEERKRQEAELEALRKQLEVEKQNRQLAAEIRRREAEQRAAEAEREAERQAAEAERKRLRKLAEEEATEEERLRREAEAQAQREADEAERIQREIEEQRKRDAELQAAEVARKIREEESLTRELLRKTLGAIESLANRIDEIELLLDRADREMEEFPGRAGETEIRAFSSGRRQTKRLRDIVDQSKKRLMDDHSGTETAEINRKVDEAALNADVVFDVVQSALANLRAKATPWPGYRPTERLGMSRRFLEYFTENRHRIRAFVDGQQVNP